jgi:nicotinamide-nucleotide amidase
LPCTIELLSVGNELLLGNTVNTNASWLAVQITALGALVNRTTTVRDDLEEISDAVTEAVGRGPDFIITTGGIGPTFDDMTVKAIARALHLKMRLDETAVGMIREYYAREFPRQKIELTRARLKMALTPSGARSIPNPVGSAPGVHLLVRKTQIFCLPGVPKEAKAIFRESLSPAIRSKAGRMVFAERWIRVQGIMESSLAPIIDSVMGHWRGVYIKSHPRGNESGGRVRIELHFSILTSDSAKAQKALLGAIADTIMRLRDFKAKVTKTG